jgi:hypothetical protein
MRIWFDRAVDSSINASAHRNASRVENASDTGGEGGARREFSPCWVRIPQFVTTFSARVRGLPLGLRFPVAVAIMFVVVATRHLILHDLGN